MQAVECFLSQTYQRKELLICDDADDPSFPADTDPLLDRVCGLVSVMALTKRETIACKRNMLAEMANGDIIFTLDDDDWSAPERMAEQVQRLEESGKAVTGYSTMLFHDGERAYRYKGMPNYALGTSLCYLRSWAVANPFEDSPKRIDPLSGLNIASDNGVVFAAVKQQQLVAVDGGALMVARMHPKNTSSSKWRHKDQSPNYRPVSLDQIPAGFPG